MESVQDFDNLTGLERLIGAMVGALLDEVGGEIELNKSRLARELWCSRQAIDRALLRLVEFGVLDKREFFVKRDNGSWSRGRWCYMRGARMGEFMRGVGL